MVDSNISPAKFLIRKCNVSGNRQMEEVGNANTSDQLQCCLQNGIQTESGSNTKKIYKI